MQNSHTYQRNLFWILLACALIFGTYHAYSLRYVNDDAFISFRYARNLLDGNGLVYNAGEKVEGYTNFLWTLLIALGMKMGWDPVGFSEIAGIVFFILTIVVYGVLSWRLQATGTSRAVWVPLTALALAVHRDCSVYATSGLETSMFSFLVSLSLAAVVLGSSGVWYALSGCIMAAAVLTRPDGVIFFVAAGLSLVLLAKGRIRSVLAFGLPFVAFYVPYWIWRYTYYGFVFPNTYYAKSVDQAYFSQGLEYFLLYFKTYYVLLLSLPVALIALWKARSSLLRSSSGGRLHNRMTAHALVLGSLSCLLYVFFVVRMGGDFMFARFFVPITPILLFLLELSIAGMKGRWVRMMCQTAVVAGIILRSDQFRDGKAVGYVTDECQIYTEDNLRQVQKKGAVLRNMFQGLPVTVAFMGSQASLVYYANPAVAIEANTGLTDSFIAHQPLAGRGRPGHEKQAPPWYIYARRVNFVFGSFTVPEGGTYIDRIRFKDIAAKIVVYDNSLMSALARNPDITFVRFPDFLDAYIAGMKSLPAERIMNDYEIFRKFYFEHNDDPLREQAFLSALSISGQQSPQ